MKTINSDILKAAAFADKTGVRPALAGVLITDDSIVATDSYKLIKIDRTSDDLPKIEDFPIIPNVSLTESLPAEGVLLPAKDILKKLKFPINPNLPILSTAALCNETEKTISFATTDLETANVLQLKKITEKFPEYQRVFPTTEAKAKVIMNAKCLVEALEAFIIKGSEGNRVEIEFHDFGTPIILKGCEKANSQITALVMPRKY